MMETIKEAIIKIINSTEKLLATGSIRPTEDVFNCLHECEKFLLEKNEQNEELVEALQWLVNNYKKLLKRERVSTVVESFSYAKSLL